MYCSFFKGLATTKKENELGGTLSVMVIIIRNIIRGLSSNPGWGTREYTHRRFVYCDEDFYRIRQMIW